MHSGVAANRDPPVDLRGSQPSLRRYSISNASQSALNSTSSRKQTNSPIKRQSIYRSGQYLDASGKTKSIQSVNIERPTRSRNSIQAGEKARPNLAK